MLAVWFCQIPFHRPQSPRCSHELSATAATYSTQTYTSLGSRTTRGAEMERDISTTSQNYKSSKVDNRVARRILRTLLIGRLTHTIHTHVVILMALYLSQLLTAILCCTVAQQLGVCLATDRSQFNSRPVRFHVT